MGDSGTALATHNPENQHKPYEILQLSEDAEPGEEKYQKGVVKRGGYVGYRYGDARVNGWLAVTRSAGDDVYGKGCISARPKLVRIPLPATKEERKGMFVLHWSDGIDGKYYSYKRDQSISVASTHQIGMSFLKKIHEENKPLGQVRQEIVQASKNTGSADNLAIVTVPLGDAD